MTKGLILKPTQSYSFSSYYDMAFEPEDILAEFDYGLSRAALQLPHAGGELASIATLKADFQRRLPYVSLTSEMARREVLIAPVVLALVDHIHAQLRIEYSIYVSEWLKGSLDYYLHTDQKLLIIEAKKADLSRGFTQLAVELIALDQWTENESTILYGAVTTGDIWQFGQLNRRSKQIVQDLNLYRVPADLEVLFQTLMGVLDSRTL